MTIQQMVTKVDELRPNQYTNERMVGWIYQLELLIWEALVKTHERPAGLREELTPYDEEHMTQELLVPDVWAGVYEWWLYAQMDLANMELEKYNNDMMMYNAAWRELEAWWNRNNMPVQRVKAIEYGQNARAAHGYVPDPLEV